MKTLTLSEISLDHTSLFSGVAFFRSKTVLSRIKTTVWRSPFSHVGLVYRSSSYDGIPRYAITYMDEIQGLTTKPLIQFILDNKLLEHLEIRPIMLSKITALKYSLSKYFGRVGTMENFDRTNFQTELASMFSINNIANDNLAITNIDFVVKALLDAEILTPFELDMTNEEDEEPVLPDLKDNNTVVQLVGQLFSLMGIEGQEQESGRGCIIKNLHNNSYHNLERQSYVVALPEISGEELNQFAKERLAMDRQCSSTFLSAMFETTLAEDIILDHVADELDTTTKARSLFKQTNSELVRELAHSLNDYLTLVRDTYKERSSSAETYLHDQGMCRVMEVMGSLALLNDVDEPLPLKYMC